MTMREYLKKYRSDIDTYIKGKCQNIPRLNDTERQQWIANDEVLYRCARRAGVRV